MSLTYNAIGNILTKTVGANTMVYSYHPVKKHAVQTLTFNGTAYNFTYDQNGNMLTGYDFTDSASIGSRTMTYDEDNNLANIVYVKGGQTATATMSYDEGGQRVKKVGTTTTYYLNEQYEIKDGVVTKHILAGNQKLVVLNNNVAYYFHGDHLGSAAVMTDSTGAVVETTDYLPFGAVRAHTGNSVSNYKYTGQELDPESGLYYFKSRYYDNVLARFIQPDGIYPNLYDPQALNGYTYCGNNPMIYTDPDGHWGDIAIGIAVAAFWTFFSAGTSAIVAGVMSGGDMTAITHGALIGAVCGAVAQGMGYVAGAVLSGAVTGAVGGAMNAAMNGGDIAKGMLMGAAIGAATAFVSYEIGEAWDWAKGPTQTTGGGSAGRGDASIGALYASHSAGVYDVDPGPGVDVTWDYVRSLNGKEGITIDAAKVFDNCMKQYRDALGDTVYGYLDENNIRHAFKSVSTFAKEAGKELAGKASEISTEFVHEVVVGMGGYAPKAYFYTGLLSKAASGYGWYSVGAYTLGTSFMTTAETYCGIVAGYNPFFK